MVTCLVMLGNSLIYLALYSLVVVMILSFTFKAFESLVGETYNILVAAFSTSSLTFFSPAVWIIMYCVLELILNVILDTTFCRR